ncbi:MAG: hypothetical protein GEV08_00395 [Acidimicrobiia bacterium]|nr:hypothetical protein [Acidimicrobiia bacterium]
MLIDTPLLVVGRGPAALLVARFVSGSSMSSLLAGHEVLGGEVPVVLDPEAVAVLTPHGVLDVLRPYLAAAEPPAIAPATFEEVLKHHCVADMNITVYDGLELVERVRRGEGVTGVLTDGRARWEVTADAFVDAAELPSWLAAAIPAAAERADAVLHALH